MVALGPTGQLGVQFVPGTMLGKYELLATIGVGGMANVILARQRGPAGFEKVVVLKVIHAHMAQDPVAINMLLDEARVAAQIDHQNVVHTYELGEAHGTYYIAMEYLAGESLAQVLKRASRGEPALDPYLAARIVADAAAGLNAAHELQDLTGRPLEIVHRDVSPGNIVVLYNGGVKVVDFGIAKAHGRVTSTQDGELKGKYGYMAPEQIRNETMDRRSDVFSLGVVLWEALSLRRLFQADNVGATLMQILSAVRVPPSHHRPAVPPALDAIAVKALAADPNDRYQTVADMKQAIEDVIWQTRYGAADIEKHMIALFSDRMEQRRTLLAHVAGDALSASDLASLGAAFQDPGSKSRPSPLAQRMPTSPIAPMGMPVAMSMAMPMAMPMERPVQRRTPDMQPERRNRLPIVLGGGVVAGVLAALIAGLFGGDEPVPPATEPPPSIAKLAAGSADITGPARAPSSPLTVEPIVEPVAEPIAEPEPVAEPESVAEPERVAEPEPVAEPELIAEPEPIVEPAPVASSEPARKKERAAASKPEPAKRSRGSAAQLTKEATESYLSGDFEAAEAAYRRALASDRGHAPAYRGLGFLYQRTGAKAKAIEALRTYLRLAPNAKDGAAVRKRIQKLGGS